MGDVKDTIAAFYDAWRNNNPAAFDDCLTEDFVDHNPAPGFAPDREGTKQFCAMVMDASKDVDMKVSPIVVDGDNGAAFWNMEWTQVGDFMGMVPADGKRLQLEGHDFYKLKGDRIAEVWHAENIMNVMMQLGVITPPGA
jgi:predicted ester cyclase